MELTIITAKAGDAQLDTSSTAAKLHISGEWTLANYARLKQLTDQLAGKYDDSTQVDLNDVTRLDTAGASLLVELLGSERVSQLAETTPKLPAADRALLQTVYSSMRDFCVPVKEPEQNTGIQVLSRIGCAVDKLWQDCLQLLGFIGLILQTLTRNFFRPTQWRITPVVAHIEQIGLNAAPIVVLLTFMVGAVVAFLGATAILLAGRTASAFTAQIGSMKANEEIDAIRTLGLDTMDLLVLPRVLALLIALPLLTFLAMMAGILGGAMVCIISLGISPDMFISLLHSDIGVQHFLVGMVKAPFFAFLIAAVGCLEGFKVTGSAESVGAHTTSSVVQSIFIVIVLDAVAALFFMEMGW